MTIPFRPLDSCERTLLLLLAGLFAVQLVLIGLYPILDKSEARYALIIWRMVETGNWVTPSIDGIAPFWGKPPLGFWLAAAAMKVFGINEFAARLPSLLVNLAMTCLIVDVGRRMRDRAFGLSAGIIFASMGLVFVLSGQVLIDPVLALGITLAMIAFWQLMATGSRVAGYVVFVGLAMTVMTKGLIGIVFAGGACLVWVLLQRRFLDTFRRLPVVTGTLLMLALVAPWYLLAELRTPGFLNYFIIGEHFQRFLQPGWTGDLYGVGRKQFPGAIWLFLLVGALPWSGVMIGALLQPSKRVRLALRAMLSDPWIRFLLAWMFVPLLFYSLTRNLVLYYVLPSLPPLALLIAQALRNLGPSVHRWTLPGWALALPVIGGVLVAVVNLKPDVAFLASQKHIVASWQQQRGPDDDMLVYLFDLPFSASFYSRGNAGLANDPAVMGAAGEQQFFAVPERSIDHIPPAILAKFETVARGNNMILLKRLRPAFAASQR